MTPPTLMLWCTDREKRQYHPGYLEHGLRVDVRPFPDTPSMQERIKTYPHSGVMVMDPYGCWAVKDEPVSVTWPNGKRWKPALRGPWDVESHAEGDGNNLLRQIVARTDKTVYAYVGPPCEGGILPCYRNARELFDLTNLGVVPVLDAAAEILNHAIHSPTLALLGDPEVRRLVGVEGALCEGVHSSWICFKEAIAARDAGQRGFRVLIQGADGTEKMRQAREFKGWPLCIDPSNIGPEEWEATCFS